jgi:hypothetical protein
MTATIHQALRYLGYIKLVVVLRSSTDELPSVRSENNSRTISKPAGPSFPSAYAVCPQISWMSVLHQHLGGILHAESTLHLICGSAL